MTSVKPKNGRFYVEIEENGETAECGFDRLAQAEDFAESMVRLGQGQKSFDFIKVPYERWAK